MRIDVLRGLCAALALAPASLPVAAQAPVTEEAEGDDGPSLVLVDEDTRIESVDFRFLSGSALDPAQLRSSMATHGPGAFAGIQEALDFLPGVSGPERNVFSPLQLQMDVARLRRLYRQAGFRDAQVDYDVSLDTATNRVSVDFVIDQREPLVVGAVEPRWLHDPPLPDTGAVVPPAPIPPELEEEWARQVERLENARGRRLGSQERARLEMETAQWFLEHGYPWVYVRMEPVDTTERAVDVRIAAVPGPRARVDAVEIEGDARLSREVLMREIPVEVGEWYDDGEISDGEAELYGLQLVRQALGDVTPGQPHDSTVSLRFRIEESMPRLVWGRVGWRSETGASGEAHWTHRNFLGDARVLTTSVAAESGWGALEEAWGRNAGISASLLQPYLWHRHVSATVGPFLTWRDDFRDRSIVYGVESALIYQRTPLEMVSLQYELSRLSVREALELLPIGEAVARGEAAFSPTFVRSIFRLSGAYGQLDDRIDPRSGFLVEPSLELSGPLSEVEYFRMAGDALVAVPFGGRTGLFVRGSAGRVFPFGVSDPVDPGLAPRALVGLRSAMFTAGGTADVRGWGAGMLGPKVPEVVLSPEGVVSERYLPVGGLARLTGSVELMLPFPFLSAPHRSFLFLDAGRVWSTGDRFRPAEPALAIEPWGYGAGAGAQISSPVGPVRLSVGYKLNPTLVDLLSPTDVARALAEGRNLSTLETHSLRRWHIHLAIGRSL